MATKPQTFPKIVEEWNVDDDDFPETKMEEAVTTSVSPTDDDSSKKPNQNKNKPSIAPAPLSSLFRFASTQDLIVLGLGFFFCILSSITMPAINIIFGSVIDSIAEPINVQELVNTSVRGMIGLGIYGFITFAVSFWLCGKAAACVANGYRMRYVEALLQQDMSFFDNAEPGSLTLMLSDSAMTIQMGLSDKFAQGVQGVFQFLFGFAIAFSFGPILSLVLMACVPFLCAVTVAMFMWGSEDGIFGKEAYEQAATIANETISNIRTVISLNAEPMMSKRYDSKLGESEKAAIRQGTRNAFLTGLLFFVIFCMYGFGFWFGARLIAKSIDSAIEAHPPPDGLLDDTESPYRPIIDLACGQYSDNAEALAVCACGLPWTTIVEDLDVNTDEFPLPNCGCGYEETSQGVTSVLMGCLSGGRVMMVFFSILIGGFSLSQVGPGIKALADARIAAAKILAVIDRKPTIGDDEKSKRLDKANVQGELTFENLHFTYETSKYTAHKDDDEFDVEKVSKLVFGGCNLTIKAGETVALVGESGCGKSTIAKLVSRFYDPTEGRILLDGTDLRNINVQDLRSCIGIVSQEPLLFDTTIEENIRYGKPGATLEDIQQAAEKANAHEFISALPDGYKTLVGARGGKLSGGQKQRVAIARAILRDPPILILDEATSALDSKSERIVQAALDNLIQQGDSSGIARSRTIIVIAHRLSTVRNADRIVVLGSPEGTSTVMTGSIILEEGSHDALLEKENGFYRALVGAGQSSGGGLGLIDDQVGRQSGVSETRSKETGTGTPSLGSEPLKGEEGEADEENESKFGLASFFGKKDTKEAAKEAEEKKILADRKARVWTYTRPELGFIGFGATASAIKGSIMPLLSIFFTRMIVVWFDSDTSEMMRRSAQYSFFFYGIALLYMITEAVQKGVFEMVGERLTKRMRGDLFRAILRKDVTWFEDEENSAGVLSSRLSTDVKLVRLVAGQSVASTLESCSSLLTGTIIAAVASWQVFLVMIALVPLLAIAEALQFTAMQSSEGKIREQLSDSTSKLHEMISGIREVQAFSLQRVGIDNIEKRIKDTIIPVSSRAAIAKGITMGVINAAQFFVYALAFWAGGKLISSGAVEFDDFLQALWAMAFAGSGLGQAALFAGDAAKAAAAVTAVFKTLDYIPKIDSEPWENNGVADKDTLEPKVRQISNKTLEDGQGELSQVNFAYPTRKGAKIFDQIDLTIPSGRVVALVGASGSGKSTVVQLLLRFYDPISYKEGVDGDDLIDVVVDDGKLKTTDGVVKLDGLDIREEDLRWLRSNMGYVGQEPVLFNDTVYNNIAMGKQGCTRAEVEAAAKSANAYDFILRLEDGFDTMVGLGGGKVSGGQKQRIAIARALVSNPKILILDEATSALDNESEKIVQESLDSLMKESAGSRTTIVIAHRLSTIRGADSICVLENQGDGSRVVEMGSHDELIEKGEKYAALVQAYESS